MTWYSLVQHNRTQYSIMNISIQIWVSGLSTRADSRAEPTPSLEGRTSAGHIRGALEYYYYYYYYYY